MALLPQCRPELANDYFDTGQLWVLPTQGGGHGDIRKCAAGMSFVAKPLILRQAWFYRRMRGTPFTSVIPLYLGTTFADGRSWVVLSDLTSRMASPCAADLKLGTRSFEVSVSPAKACSQLPHTVNAITSTHAIPCVDICIRRDGCVTRHWDRSHGRKMSVRDLRNALAIFLPGRRMEAFHTAISNIKDALGKTEAVLPDMGLYSASVVVAYDGNSGDESLSANIIHFTRAHLDVAAEWGE
jgi:hypothetical protein